MNEWAGGYPGALVSPDEATDREFEERLQQSSRLAFRVAYGVLRHRQDAEDVAQEAFARAYRRFDQLRDRERFRAWLVRMTWRLAIDRWRAERRRSAREQAAPVPGDIRTIEQDLVSRERAESLWRAIDALPEKLRVVTVLAAIEEHDVRSVAGLLGLPEGTVKSRLFLARKGLAEKLRCLENDPSAR
jgi:RNA polymerase sigma-70 factor (ECF subfamily)